jgi:hypothetical protein
MLSVEVKICDRQIILMKATRISPKDPDEGETCYYRVGMEGSDLTTVVAQPYDMKVGAQKLAQRLLDIAMTWNSTWLL